MSVVSAWEDDPRSFTSAAPVTRPEPRLDHSRLGVHIEGEAPPARRYTTETPAFRYWNAADALARSTTFWAAIVPSSTRWTCGSRLGVMLDAGADLNAYYDRQRLCFFHAPVNGGTVYSGESPDVVCHEFGHAVLDALAPALWNTAALEAAAAHEAFGDVSAMLSALQLESVRRAVLRETGGQVGRNSRLSRLAEQLGWAIRQAHPDAVDRDCLRNAANSFFYAEPESLPPMAPAVTLSSEPHSFSRVLTAAWLDALAGMAALNGSSESGLGQASTDAGRLVALAVRCARVAPNYFAQVAAETIRADASLFGGRYRLALQQAFVGRGILASDSARAAAAKPRRRGRAAERAAATGVQSRRIQLDGRTFGLRVTSIVVDAPPEAGPGGAVSAAPDLGPLPPTTADRACRAFVEDLLRRHRVDPGPLAVKGRPAPASERTTHALVQQGTDAVLIRTRFHELIV